MAEEKTTSRMTSATNDMDWYTANGWQVFNKLPDTPGITS